jgi:cobalt-zinc-cadmium efflux system membrane fusion protein
MTMTLKNMTMLGVILVLATVGTVRGQTCADQACAAPAPSATPAGEAPAPESIAARLAANCEEGFSLPGCDKCRYEGGFVKLAADIMKKSDDTGLVETAPVQRRTAEEVVEATGEIVFNESRTAHVSPRIEGIIRKVSVDVGDRVKAGDVLFEIDSVELGRATTDYVKNRRLAELTRKTLEREQALFEQKVAPEASLIEAQMAYEEHRANADSAGQMLRVLGLDEKDLEAALKKEDNAPLGVLAFRAPFEGTIVERHATIGERVEPGADVMLLSDVSTLWVAIDVHETVMARLDSLRETNPVPVSIRVDGCPDRSFPSTIERVGVRMDKVTRTVQLRGAVANDEGLLRPGMFCKAQLGLPGAGEVLAVPQAAVMTDAGVSFVFVQAKDDIYARQDVKLGRSLATHVEILEGVKEGDTMVTAGAFLLKSDILRGKMGAGCAD